jgi:hypothetical protein
MSSVLRRIHSAMSPVALLLAILALMASAAGAGFAAATVGTAQLKNNAVTAQKIKKNAVTTKKIKKNAVTGVKIQDGSVTVADLPAEEAQHAAALGSGGEGDCVWQSGAALIPGLSAPTFRKDRFGTVHLTGIAVVADGAGGDGVCDPSDSGQSSDAIAFTLPAGYVPAKTVIVGNLASGGAVIIVGAQGLNSPGLVLPPGAVATADTLTGGVLLDNISFQPAGSSVVIPKMTASGRITPGFLKLVGLG